MSTDIAKATTAQRDALRQPPGETCDSPEQALAIIRLDGFGTRQGTFALAYLNGWVAGRVYCFGGDLTDEQVAQRTRAYESRCGALSLQQVLRKTLPFAWDPDELTQTGWLAGWSDATEYADNAVSCNDSACNRRLFEDLDSPHYCKHHGTWGCATPTRDCFAAWCDRRNGTHAVECWGDE